MWCLDEAQGCSNFVSRSAGFYGSDLALVERSILSMDTFDLLIIFWVTVSDQHGNQEILVYETDDFPVIYSFLSCCMKSASTSVR